MTEAQQFEQRIRRFSAVRRRLLNAALGYRLAVLALIAGVAGLLLLGGWIPGALVNLGLFAALALFVLALVCSYPLRHVRYRQPLDEAFHMESLHGKLNSRVVSAWDFLHWPDRSPLAAVVIERAKSDLQFEYEALLDRSERNRRRKQAAIWLAVWIGLGCTPWFAFGRVRDNIRHSWIAARDYFFPVEFSLQPEPGTHIHRLNDSVELGLHFARRGYQQVKLVSQIDDEPPTETVVAADDDGWARRTVTSPVEAEHRLYFRFGERQTEPIHLVFTTAPTLVNMQTELVYPGYTGLLPRPLEGIQQRLLGLPGTRMTLGFTFSKELESATITWPDGQELPLETVGRFASTNLVHNQTRQGRLQVRDIHGLELDDPLLIDFELQNDEKPQVLLPRHLKEDMPLLETVVDLFGFGVRAQDDYGVTRLVLRWQKSTVDNPASVTEQGEVERLISPAQRNAVVSFEKMFAGLTLKPGDKVSFDVEAFDNRTPEKQHSRSRRLSLFIYQPELSGLSISQLGFGGMQEMGAARIAKSTRATAVKAPEGIRSRELVRNEHEASVVTSTRAPTARGEHSQATQDYFRLLSKVPYQDEESSASPAKRPTAADDSLPETPATDP
jgi:hypothetical protein